jgi:hypothetical protein
MSLMKQFLAALGICIATGVPASTAVFYKPYAEAHVNYLYNLLFCDNLDLFKSDKSAESNGLWRTLLAEPPDLKALQRIAENESNEGRVRAIAFNRLRAAGQKVAKKKILGVIVEIPQPQGLATRPRHWQSSWLLCHSQQSISLGHGIRTVCRHQKPAWFV